MTLSFLLLYFLKKSLTRILWIFIRLCLNPLSWGSPLIWSPLLEGWFFRFSLNLPRFFWFLNGVLNSINFKLNRVFSWFFNAHLIINGDKSFCFFLQNRMFIIKSGWMSLLYLFNIMDKVIYKFWTCMVIILVISLWRGPINAYNNVSGSWRKSQLFRMSIDFILE